MFPLLSEILHAQLSTGFEASTRKNDRGCLEWDMFSHLPHYDPRHGAALGEELDGGCIEPQLHPTLFEGLEVRADEPLSAVLHAQRQAAPELVSPVDLVCLSVEREDERHTDRLGEPPHRLARVVHDGPNERRAGLVLPETHDITRKVVRGVRRDVDLGAMFRVCEHVGHEGEEVCEAGMHGAKGACGEIAVPADPFFGCFFDDQDAVAASLDCRERRGGTCVSAAYDDAVKGSIHSGPNTDKCRIRLPHVNQVDRF